MLAIGSLLPVIISVAVVIALWRILPAIARFYRSRKLLEAVPLPRNIPCHWLFGHTKTLLQRNEDVLLKITNGINESGKDHPGLVRLHVGPLTTISVVHSKHVGLFLKEPKSSRVYRVLLLPWLGEGLLISEGKKWQRNRKLLTPAFHYSILRNYVSIYNKCVSLLINKWKLAAQEEKTVNVFKSISAMSLDIILQCAFSFKSACQEEKTRHPYVVACGEIIKQISNRGLSLLYRFDFIYWRTSHGRKMKELCKIVHSHAEKIIDKRRASLASAENAVNVVSPGNGSTPVTKHYDFLDILLLAQDEEGNGMSDLEIRNEVDTFLFEGHDTTTSGMSWTLYCLAQNTHHQDKVREEVKRVLKGKEFFDHDDLKNLTYTTLCIKEAMRLYPPVFGFARKTSRDILAGKCLLPAGTNVRIDVYQIHHNASIWENPMEFNPLRFQPSNMENRSPYDYIPFSAGSRNCIGQNFAMNEMKVVIGSIISRFQVSLDQEHEVSILTTVILRTRTDIKLYLKDIKA